MSVQLRIHESVTFPGRFEQRSGHTALYPGSLRRLGARTAYDFLASAVRRHWMRIVACALCVASVLSAPAKGVQDNLIKPGGVWLDNRGQEIQAHGGSVIKVRNVYYWVGEDRGKENAPDKRYISCYSSKDLVRWTFRGHVLVLTDRERLGPGWVLERPKLFYNAKTGKYVMYLHIDSSDYSFARVAVAVSGKVDGQYQYQRSFRPLGKESRDIGEFVDDDGTAYLIFESRPSGGFYIASLSDDYLDVKKEVCLIHEPLEGGAIVRYAGLYYVIGSHLTGWNPNPNVFATASSLKGPWTSVRNIAPPETNTYDSQSGMLIRVAGKRGTSVIYAGDRWNPGALWDSRYVWLPVQIGGGNFVLCKPHEWSIDLKDGLISAKSGIDPEQASMQSSAGH